MMELWFVVYCGIENLESGVRKFQFGVHLPAEGPWASSKIIIVTVGLIHARDVMLSTLQAKISVKAQGPLGYYYFPLF